MKALLSNLPRYLAVSAAVLGTIGLQMMLGRIVRAIIGKASGTVLLRRRMAGLSNRVAS